MPTYIVTVSEGRLTAAQKAAVASAITTAHAAATGAPAFFAQVLINEVCPGHWFLGGQPFSGEQIYVHGHIRSGRPPDIKARLMTELCHSVAKASGFQDNQTWIYVCELPPSQMIEFGRVLPEHGKEAEWNAALPPDELERLQAFARPKT